MEAHRGWRDHKMDKRPGSPDLAKSGIEGSSQPEDHGQDAKAAVTSPVAASLNDF